MSLLSIAQNVADETSLSRPGSVYNNSDTTARKLLRCIYRGGEYLVQQAQWPELLKQHSITLATGVAEYALPSDLDRVVFETEWNNDQGWPLLGPMTVQEYQERVHGMSSTAPSQHFIAIQDTIGTGTYTGDSAVFTIYPTPTASENGQVCYFRYVSNAWIISATGTIASTFSADTDTTLLRESLVELATLYYTLLREGLPFENVKRELDDRIKVYSTAKTGARRLRLSGHTSNWFVTVANLPDGGWG